MNLLKLQRAKVKVTCFSRWRVTNKLHGGGGGCGSLFAEKIGVSMPNVEVDSVREPTSAATAPTAAGAPGLAGAGRRADGTSQVVRIRVLGTGDYEVERLTLTMRSLIERGLMADYAIQRVSQPLSHKNPYSTSSCPHIGAGQLLTILLTPKLILMLHFSTHYD